MKLFRPFLRKTTTRDLNRSPHNPATGLTPPAMPPGGGPTGNDLGAGDGFIPVVSSWIAGMRFEPYVDEGEVSGVGMRGTLRIAKRDGGVMNFSDVPEGVYDDFFAAGSKGEFFNKYIREQYVYTRG